MVTVVAVTGPVADPAADGLPTTVTQLPTVTSFAVAVIVSVIGVLAVKVTVTCPEVGFWTSRLDPGDRGGRADDPGKGRLAGRRRRAAARRGGAGDGRGGSGGITGAAAAGSHAEDHDPEPGQGGGPASPGGGCTVS